MSGGLGPDGAGPWLAGPQPRRPAVLRDLRLPALPPVGRRAARGDGAAVAGASTRVRRALRIVPAYWVALVLIALLLGRDGVFDWPGRARLPRLRAGLRPRALHRRDRAGVDADGRGRVLRGAAAARARGAAAARPGAARRAAAARRARRRVACVWRAVVLATVDPADPAYFPLLLALPAQLDVFAGGMALAVPSAAGREGRAARPAGSSRRWPTRLLGAVAPRRRHGARRRRARAAGARGDRAARAGGPRRRAAPVRRSLGVAPARLGRARLLRHLPVAPRRAARAGRARPARARARRLRPRALARARRGELVRPRAPRAAAGPARGRRPARRAARGAAAADDRGDAGR